MYVHNSTYINMYMYVFSHIHVCIWIHRQNQMLRCRHLDSQTLQPRGPLNFTNNTTTRLVRVTWRVTGLFTHARCTTLTLEFVAWTKHNCCSHRVNVRKCASVSSKLNWHPSEVDRTIFESCNSWRQLFPTACMLVFHTNRLCQSLLGCVSHVWC